MTALRELGQKYGKLVSDERLLALYVISCMILVPVAELIGEINGIMFFGSASVITVYAVLGAFICILNMILAPFGRHWSDIFFVTLILFLLISIVFSCDPFPYRQAPQEVAELPEYGILYSCMMFCAFRIRSSVYRTASLLTIAGVSVLHGIVGVFQSFGLIITPVTWHPTTYEVYGLTQNSNFYGSLSVLFTGCLLGLFIFRWKKITAVISASLLLLSAYCLICSMARLAWVSLLLILMIIPVSLAVMKRKDRLGKDHSIYMKRYLAALLIIALACILALLNPGERGLIGERFSLTAHEIGEEGIGSYGSYRVNIWKICLESVPKHWATGVGYGNLYRCFLEQRWFDPDNYYYTGFAHNTYLHVLVTQGVFAFINYIALLTVSAVAAVKRIINTSDDTDRKITWTCFLMFAGYLAASFFGCRVSYVEFYFFIVIGLMIPAGHGKVERDDG